jgi:hypothetical protein
MPNLPRPGSGDARDRRIKRSLNPDSRAFLRQSYSRDIPPGGRMSDMSAEPAEALEVLREVWRGRGQTAADLDDPTGEQKSCKRMADAGVGFDDFASDGDLVGAWRAKLAREGKLSDSGGTVRDLVLGPDEAR